MVSSITKGTNFNIMMISESFATLLRSPNHFPSLMKKSLNRPIKKSHQHGGEQSNQMHNGSFCHSDSMHRLGDFVGTLGSVEIVEESRFEHELFSLKLSSDDAFDHQEMRQLRMRKMEKGQSSLSSCCCF
jgi:hypothetical protein